MGKIIQFLPLVARLLLCPRSPAANGERMPAETVLRQAVRMALAVRCRNLRY